MSDDSRTAAPSRASVVLAFAAVYVLWGSTYLAIRFGVESIPPFVLAGTRHLTAGVLLFAWTRWRGGPRPTVVQWRNAFLIGGLLLVGGNGLVTWAEQRVPSGLAALIVSSVPIWMALLEGIHKRKRPGAALLAGLVLGIAGIALLVLPGRFAGNGHVDPRGAVALLCAALCWSAGSLLSRRTDLPSSTLTATAMEMLGGGALLWLVGLVFGEGGRISFATISPRSALSLVYLIVFGSLIGFSAYVWLLKVTTPARVSTYAYVNPIVALVLGAVLAGEAVTPRVLLAALIVVGAVALIITARSRPEPAIRTELPSRPRSRDRDDSALVSTGGGR